MGEPADAADQKIRRTCTEVGPQPRDLRRREAPVRLKRLVDREHLASIRAQITLLPLGDHDQSVHLQKVRTVDPHVQRGNGRGFRIDATEQTRAATKVRVDDIRSKVLYRFCDCALLPEPAGRKHRHRSIEIVADADAPQSMRATDHDRDLVPTCVCIAHLGGRPFRAGKAGGEQQMHDPHGPTRTSVEREVP